MNRRNLITGALSLAATGLIIPERKVWALDQTMLLPKPSQGSMLWWAEQAAWNKKKLVTVHDIDQALKTKYRQDFLPGNGDGWTLIHHGPEVTGAPYDTYIARHERGANFTLRIDCAAHRDRYAFQASEIQRLKREYEQIQDERDRLEMERRGLPYA